MNEKRSSRSVGLGFNNQDPLPFQNMSATNFNTKNDTCRNLMGNGLTYRIPRFQRDYSWTGEECGSNRRFFASL